MCRTQLFRICLVVVAAVAPLECRPRTVRADDKPARPATVVAPAGTVQLRSAPGGAYYVDRGLLEQYEALKSRVRRVREMIASGTSSRRAALEELESIEAESAKVRLAIEANQQFVAVFKVFKKTEEQTFPLAPSRRIVVRGDNVTVRGWDGPGIKTVVEKVILAREQPPAAAFAAIRVQHQVAVPEDIVGKTREQRAADEEAFLNSPAGKKMTPAQLAARRAFIEQLFGGDDVFADFQGQAVNDLAVTGLRHEEGNRQLTIPIESPEGGASLSSQWQRHAAVTIYVPHCEHLLVAGCLVSLDIRNLRGNLLLTTRASRDRDYHGSFEVRNIDGDVTIDQAPVRLLDGVSGNVRFTATDEFVNSGTRHVDDSRTAYSFETKATEISNVQNNLVAWFLRTNLRVTGVGGVIDIRNEFGSTELDWRDQTKLEAAMRVVSESGTIKLTGPRKILESIPLYAHTLCGTLHSNLQRSILDDVSFSTGNPRRSWSGFVTPSQDRFAMDRFERPMQAWEGRDRSPGLDLISRSGQVSITARGAADPDQGAG